LATQNPIEYEGTFPLPEAQLDRFLLRIHLGYPEPSQEVNVLQRQMVRHPIEDLGPVTSAHELQQLQQSVRGIHVDPQVQRYIVHVVGLTRDHPDVLPVAPAAGGWDGMKRLADTCAELGYTFTLHDQYRDYYVESPSYDPQFAVHEEDATAPPTIFPGTRFGSWKEGQLSFLADPV